MSSKNVRNFWIELDVDGRETRIEAGPRDKEGGFVLNLKMRDQGEIKHTLKVRGFVDFYGQLQLEVVNFYGRLVWDTTTSR